MMRRIKNRFIWIPCMAGCLLSAMPVWSEPEEEGEDRLDNPWDMSTTAAPFTRPGSLLSIGVGNLTGQRQRLGTFDGQSQGSGRLLLETRIRKREEATGTWLTLQGRNLGLEDNRDIQLGYEKQGAWGLRLAYTQILRNAPYEVNSRNEGLGTTLQVVPKTSSTPGDGTTHPIGTERERLTLNLFNVLNDRLKLNLGFRNETKEGTRHWGRGTNEFLLEPVRWQMRQFEPTLSYVTQDLQLLGGYSGSWFHNDHRLVDTVSANDGSHIYMSLPLDNEAHQFFVSGGYNVTEETRGTFKLAYTRALQNERIPTVDIAGLSRSGVPTHLQGRVDTTLALLGLSARPLPKLSMTAKLRYYDEKDRTPAWLIADRTSSATVPGQVHTTPLSIQTLSGQVEGTYRLPYQTTLTGAVEQKNQERQIPFGSDLFPVDGLDDERYVPWRTELDETTYRLRLRRPLSTTLDGSLQATRSIRTGSNYANSVKIMGNNQGKISPFFIADRDQDKLRLAMDWRPFERLGLQFGVENIWDRYNLGQDPYGRQKGEAQLYSVDLDYAPTDQWLWTAWYSYDNNKTWQKSGRWNGTGIHEVDKESVLADRGSTVGLGVRNQWSDKVLWGTNFQRSLSKTSFDDYVTRDPNPLNTSTTYPTGLVPDLPDITAPTIRLNAFIEYKGLPGTLRWDFIHERWRTDEWIWQFSNGSPYVYGTTTDGTLISSEEGQTSNYVGVRYTSYY